MPKGRGPKGHNGRTCGCNACSAERRWKRRLRLLSFEDFAREQDGKFPIPFVTMWDLLAAPYTGRRTLPKKAI